jgi:hypothetical protein
MDRGIMIVWEKSRQPPINSVSRTTLSQITKWVKLFLLDTLSIVLPGKMVDGIGRAAGLVVRWGEFSRTMSGE